MKEIWKDIPGYEGRYQASTLGRIRSFLRNTNQPIPHLLNPNSFGRYLTVRLYKDGVYKVWLVHRLVLFTFEKEPRNGRECRHLDGNRRNNRADNLKWGTRKEQYEDQILHGTTHRGMNINAGESNGMATATEEDVKRIRRLYKTGRYSIVEIARMENKGYQQVYKIATGARWKRVSS